MEAELKRYQAMYGGEELADALTEKRRAALEAMKFFSRFRPKLVGPVLEGTSDRHSRISMHVFCETADDVIAFLLSRKISFEQESRRIRWHDNSYRDLELVVIEADGQCFELGLMAGSSWKQPPPDPVDGRAQSARGYPGNRASYRRPGLSGPASSTATDQRWSRGT